MATYIFSGRVLPERTAVSFGPIQMAGEIPDLTVKFEATISVGASEISVQLITLSGNADLPTLRQHVQAIVRARRALPSACAGRLKRSNSGS